MKTLAILILLAISIAGCATNRTGADGLTGWDVIETVIVVGAEGQ